MLLSCIIIDDEEDGIFQTKDAVEQVSELQLKACFTNVYDAKQWLLANGAVHFVFLDIEMPIIDGLQGAEMLRTYFSRLVFTTAHPQHAHKAFDLAAADYLIKPITAGKLIMSLDRQMDRMRINREELLLRAHTRFIAHYQGRFTGWQLNELQYIEAAGDYVMLHTEGRKHTIHLSLKQAYETLEQVLPLVQVHRSYVISLDYVEDFFVERVQLTNGQVLKIGRSYRQALLNDVRLLSFKTKRT